MRGSLSARQPARHALRCRERPPGADRRRRRGGCCGQARVVHSARFGRCRAAPGPECLQVRCPRVQLCVGRLSALGTDREFWILRTPSVRTLYRAENERGEKFWRVSCLQAHQPAARVLSLAIAIAIAVDLSLTPLTGVRCFWCRRLARDFGVSEDTVRGWHCLVLLRRGHDVLGEEALSQVCFFVYCFFLFWYLVHNFCFPFSAGRRGGAGGT